jgi:hypothetical protein
VQYLFLTTRRQADVTATEETFGLDTRTGVDRQIRARLD